MPSGVSHADIFQGYQATGGRGSDCSMHRVCVNKSRMDWIGTLVCISCNMEWFVVGTEPRAGATGRHFISSTVVGVEHILGDYNE